MEGTTSPNAVVETTEPLPDGCLLVDLGSLRRKQVKRLKRGEGPLQAHILAAVDRQREALGIDAAAEVVPVVLLYREDQPDYMVITPKWRTNER